MRKRIGLAALSGVAAFLIAFPAWADEPPPLPPPPPSTPPPGPPVSPAPSGPPASSASPAPPPPIITVQPGQPPPPAYRRREPPPPPPPPEADESSFVTVTLESDAPNTFLEALVTREGLVRLHWRWHTEVVYGRVARWHPVCAAPCTMRVPADLRYRVSGPNVPASDDFFLGPPGGSRHLRVSAGSRAGRSVGVVLLVVGIPTALVGGIVAASAGGNDGRTGGYVTLGVGGALTVGGAILVGINGTSVYEGDRELGKGAPAAAVARLGEGLWLTPTGLAF